MDLLSKKELKVFLREHNLTPTKRLGQHFLVSRTILQKIIIAADLAKTDLAVEIGPGVGTLTCALAEKVKKVIALEKDSGMADVLKETTNKFSNIEIILGDVLKLSNVKGPVPLNGTSADKRLSDVPYKLVSNLPYYIASPVIRKFLESTHQPTELVVMVQKEVAERLCAQPPKMNLLGVAVQFYAFPKLLFSVPKTAFWPQPSVTSAVVRITPHQKYTQQVAAQDFFAVVKAGFSHPRKQLVNNLASELQLKKEQVYQLLTQNHVDPTQRSETLTVENWIALAQSFV